MSTPSPSADRNLLFGILALQMDFISRDALVAGMNAWVLDKAKPLGQILLDRGALAAADRELLEVMVRRHLEKHGHDAERSLAALPAPGIVRAELRRITDDDVQASLVHVPTPRYADDLEATGAHVGPGTLPPHARFQILRPHAKGGLGEVFVARDEELKREVALKEIQQRHASQPESRSRFLLEAEVTGSLEHPGIVPVYGLGSYADGRPFYAMRFIKGDSLKEGIAAFHGGRSREPSGTFASLAFRQLLGRFVDVCQAIEYAHSRGVLHRDLKPGNIMLGKYGETLVVDWGLAKVLGKTDIEATESVLVSSADSGMTQAGQALGTPAFMSPEQAQGKLDELGPASDVYSLGATLYCLLTGQAPFTAGDVGAVLGKVQKGDFPPPRQVNPRVPAALEAVCLKAMAVPAPNRYPSPRELAEEIEHWLADEPVHAHRESLPARVARGARKRPALTAGIGALLLTGVIALGVSTLLIGQAQRDTSNALKNLEVEQRQRALAQLNALRDAAPGAVAGILADLQANRDEVLPRLRELWQEEAKRDKRMRLALALLPIEPQTVRDELVSWLLRADDPAEVLLVREELRTRASDLKDQLWARIEGAPKEERLRALVALAAFDPGSGRWTKLASGLLDDLLKVNPLHLGAWVNGLRPVRDALLPALAEVFRGKKGTAANKQVAALVLADYASDRPGVVIDLLVDADRQSYALLKPIVERYRNEVVARMRQEWERQPDWWKDKPLDPAWKKPDEAARREVEQAGGLVAERFALCQALPLARLQAVTEALRPAGYRPVRVRPYSLTPRKVGAASRAAPEAVRLGSPDRQRVGAASRAAPEAVRLGSPDLLGRGVEGEELIAVVWTRDGGDWKLSTSLTAAKVKTAPAGLIPVDVAGYLGKDGARYAVLWRTANKGEQAVAYAGVEALKHGAHTDGYRKDGYLPATLHGLTGPDGAVRYAGVWVRGTAKPPPGNLYWGDDENTYADRVMAGEQLLLDVGVGEAGKPHPLRAKLEADLARARANAVKMPKDANQPFYQGVALMHLGRDEEALAAFNAYFKASKQFWGHRHRAVLHARAGRAEEARSDLAAFGKQAPREQFLAARALVDVYLGRSEGPKQLDEAVKASPTDSGLLVEAARVQAHAARRVTQRRLAWTAGLVANPRLAALVTLPSGPEQAQKHRQRAIELLQQTVKAGYRNVASWQSDPDLAALTDLPAFRDLIRRSGALRRYESVWREVTTRDAVGLHAMSPEARLARCRELAAQGYRPVAMSLGKMAGEKDALAASVWHRPALPVAEKDRLAKWQGVAGATLMALGQPEAIWPMWKHSTDPTVRSHLVEQAGLRGADPQMLIHRLNEEKDTSVRRALILALGEYTEKELPAAVRGPLVQKLLAWYREDADPGIHGAVDWLLRHGKEGPAARLLAWSQRKELERIDGVLAKASRERKRPEEGKRLWYVNGQNQTFTLIPGPVTFRMGSPLTGADRIGVNEKPHVRVILRSYALQTKAVTVAQYERFLAEHPERRFPNFPKRYSPEPDGPMIWISWYDAAAYCNWLSKQEGIPKAQWCYPEKIEEGTKLYPDYLQRTGYRLPTEAEWEHACKAGATSSRYYGSSESLLFRHAHYRDNSEDRTWPVGQKRPNDLGLFDVHGNVWTWCDNPAFGYPSGRIEDKEYITDIVNSFYSGSRALRGGSFNGLAPYVRSSIRNVIRPANRSDIVGLRLCRTYHLPFLPSYNNADR